MNARNLKIGLVLLGAVLIFLFYKNRQPRFVAGEKAPDFTAVLANGQTIRFADLRGKYVLLQFWGSWCGPCRAENPHLAALYQRHRAQGFEIFSIGIEQKRSAWENAITNDGMAWPLHTVELDRFGGALPKLFNIHSIPATFLVNPNGIIMGVNLAPDRMDKMLQEALANR